MVGIYAIAKTKSSCNPKENVAFSKNIQDSTSWFMGGQQTDNNGFLMSGRSSLDLLHHRVDLLMLRSGVDAAAGG